MLLIVQFFVALALTASSLVSIEVLLLELDFVKYLTFYFILHAVCVFFPVGRLGVCELNGTVVMLSHTAY
jgi:hypothetical protein